MRHGVKLNRLGRKTAHRKALMSNLSCQLIQHKRIVTTLAKAKALRVYVEPLLTRSKTDDTHNRRMVFSYLQNKEAIIELFSNVSEKIASRPGGYTRIIKMQPRVGDAAEMAMIEIVDFNTMYNNTGVVEEKKKTRRSRVVKGKQTKTSTEAPTETDAIATDAVSDEKVDVASVAETTEVATEATEVVETVVDEVTASADKDVSADDATKSDSATETEEEKA